jgi:dTDP-4-amino-4,6-dideoxygalactose transaminase
MIPLCVPNLSGNEGAYLQECVSSTYVSTVGAFVGRFEEAVAEATAAPLAVATSTGTTGLHAAYVAAGVRPGDLVICPALTFIATANAISHAGAAPWLMDVNADSWTIDAEQIKTAIHDETERNADGELIHGSSGRRVAAITPVFTLGMPADMDSIMALAKECRIPVIVDGAAALGASYKGRPTGDLGADLTMYSFNGNKIVTAGGGGAVVGHDKKLLGHLRHLTTTARSSADYDHDMVGFNYRMTNIQAAVGCAQMEQLAVFVTAKKSIDHTYRMAFADLPEVTGFPVLDDRESACWFTGFRFLHRNGASHSRALRAALKEAGIDARPFWKPMHLQIPYKDAPREKMTVSDMIWEQIVTLPCSTQLTVTEQAFVIDTVRAWFRDNGLA